MVGLKLQMLTALLAMLALAVPANGAAFLQEFDALNGEAFSGHLDISAAILVSLSFLDCVCGISNR